VLSASGIDEHSRRLAEEVSRSRARPLTHSSGHAAQALKSAA
jgi:hypothetical protein